LTLEENRQALRKDADLHEKGLFSQLGNDFDQLDVKTTGIFQDASVRQVFSIAWNFWDSWIDERNHLFPGFYEGIAKEQWPALARRAAEDLEKGDEVVDPLLLKHFVFHPSTPLKERVKQLRTKLFSDK
jgi:hypothetical protein